MKVKKLLVTLGALTLTAFSLAACGSKSSSTSSATKAKNQTLNWSLTSEITTMDPSKVTDTTSFMQVNNTMEGLYRKGKNNTLTNALATSAKVSSDGKTYTFTLRKGAKWSNGDEVTAKDFVYGWRRTVNPKTASEYAYIFDCIKNASAIRNGKKSVNLLGVKAVGKYKLVVTLNKPVSYFKQLLATAVFYPQNENAVKKYGSKYGTASKYMVYNGPYKQVGWTGSNSTWKLVKNNTYWDKKHVYLTKINFSVNKSTTTSYNLYQSKKIDITELSSQQSKQLKNQSGYTVVKGSRTNYLSFNLKNKYLKNKYIRKALSLVINRSQLASSVVGGGSTKALGFVPSGLSSYKGTDFATAAYSKEAVAYNVKLAQKYWKKGLKQLGVSKVTLNLLGDDTDVSKSVNEYLQSVMESKLSGLTVKVTNIVKKTRVTRMFSGNYDMVVTAWGADYADPSSYLSLMTSSNTYNYGKWKSSAYDKLIAKASGTDANNTSARWSDYVKAEKVLMSSQAVSPLYYENNAYMIRTTVKGLISNTVGGWNFKSAYIASSN